MNTTYEILYKSVETLVQENGEKSCPYLIHNNNPFQLECTFYLLKDHRVIPRVSCDKKNSAKSIQFKDKGNKIFLQAKTCTDFLDAFRLYTQSIAYALNSSKELALAHANRSAVLIRLGKYKDCLTDINRTLSLNYPHNLKTKVFFRKAECLLALGKLEQAKKAHENALKWLKEMLNDSSKIRMQDKLDRFFDNVEKFETEEVEELFSVEWDNSEDAEIPCASDALAVRYNNKFGRHVVATRDIAAGEMIIAEKPYAAVLAFENVYTHCANCLNVTWSSIPCSYCVYAMYCSVKCKDNAREKYHDIECNILGFFVESGLDEDRLLSTKMAILALREAGNISNLQNELKKINACKDIVKKGFSDDGKFRSDKYRSVYSLHADKKHIVLQEIFKMCFDTAFIVYALVSHTNLFGNPSCDVSWFNMSKNRSVKFIGGLIIHHLKIFDNCLHRITENYNFTVSTRGYGIYPFLTLLNHSCDPNVDRIYHPEHAIARCLQPIKKDQQIFESYGPTFDAMLKSSRREILDDQFDFKCSCEACIKNWSTFKNLPDCKDSASKIAVELTKALTKLHKLFYKDILNDEIPTNLYMLRKVLKINDFLVKYGTKPCKEFSMVSQLLRKIFSLLGNKFDIPDVKDAK